MNATDTAQAAPAFKPLDFIDLEDETGRTSALAINGRKPDAQGWLRVTGGLPHGLGFKPKDDAARDKLMEWLCPGSVKAVNSHASLLPERDVLRAFVAKVAKDWQTQGNGIVPSSLAIEAQALLSAPPALRDGQENFR